MTIESMIDNMTYYSWLAYFSRKTFFNVDEEADKMLKRKYIISINPREDFLSFWINNCQGINTEKQLEILYDESFDFASWLLSHILDRESRKNYALYSATAVLSIFETQYP